MTTNDLIGTEARATGTYGRTGQLTSRQVKLAVVTTFSAAGSSETLARQRLLGVLAVTADDQGLARITDREAFDLAGLAENRDARKAWAHVTGTYTSNKGTSGYQMLAPDKDATADQRGWPFVLVSAENKIVLAQQLPSAFDPEHLDDIESWVHQTAQELIERGLPGWQHEQAVRELTTTATTTLAAVEPDSLVSTLTNTLGTVTALTNELDQVRRKQQQAERRKQSLEETEAALRQEIDALEAEADRLGNKQAQVAEAVRLAQDVLAAAALVQEQVQ